MILRLEHGRLKAFECYRYKEKLKIIGFAWNSKDQSWGMRASNSAIIAFANYFQKIKVYYDPGSKELLAKAQKEKGIREEKLQKIKDYKASLFDKDIIPLDGFTVPAEFDLYRHQKIALNFFYYSPLGNLYGDCGVGKTAIMLILVERLLRDKKANKVLIVCPKSIMRGAWEEDCHKFTPNLEMCILDKGFKINTKILQKDFKGHPKYKKIYDKQFDLYVITYESLKPLESIIGFLGFDVVIFDEASKLKNHSSGITKSAIKIAKKFNRRYILSGTPAPNHETEYFGQIKVLDEEVFGDTFWRFRDEYFEPVGFMGFEYELDPMKEDTFLEKLYTYGLRFKQEDCVDLPPTQDIILPSFMDSKLSSTYKTLEEEKILEINNREIPVSNPLAEMTKLRQLASSHMVDEEGTEYSFKNHKLETLRDFLESSPEEQVIIWAAFIKDIEAIGELLGSKARMLYGKTSNKTDQYSKEFKAGKVQYLICNPQSVGHGHTWTNSCINVFFSLTYSNELYTQSRKRTHRISQDKSVRYYHIVSRTDSGEQTIDEIVYYVVKNKIKRANEIMDQFKRVALLG